LPAAVSSANERLDVGAEHQDTDDHGADRGNQDGPGRDILGVLVTIQQPAVA
jgi:hypothetical protein